MEDFIAGNGFAAARRTATGTLQFDKLAARNDPPPAGKEPIVNGSVLCILVDGFLDYDELKPVAMEALKDATTKVVEAKTAPKQGSDSPSSDVEPLKGTGAP